MKKRIKDGVIIGLALFAMFFGAGNLIFPPQIGIDAGNTWKLAAFGFFITGIGLPLLGTFAAVKGGEALKKFQPKVGKGVIVSFSVVVALTLGFVAIPRTGATTHEMGFAMFVPEISPVLSAIIFFGITIALAYKPTGIIDRIGKYLTPVLVVMLGAIIIKGIIDPISVPQTGLGQGSFSKGFFGGYQTMDALGALIFGGIVLNTLREKGYKSEKMQMKMTAIAGGVAALGLSLVYGGLMYLGSTTVGMVAADVSKTSLTIMISSLLLGQTGTWMLGIGVSFACLTTSVGIVAMVGDYFSELTNGKIKYEITVIVLCLASGYISVLGVDGIVSVAGPILVVVYPIAILLITFILLDKLINKPFVYRVTIATALSFSILQGFVEAGIFANVITSAFKSIPLGEIGFPWLVPSTIAFLVSYVMTINKPRIRRRLAFARR